MKKISLQPKVVETSINGERMCYLISNEQLLESEWENVESSAKYFEKIENGGGVKLTPLILSRDNITYSKIM